MTEYEATPYEALKRPMRECPFCGAVLGNEPAAALHVEWHQIHRLHHPACDLQRVVEAQRGSDLYYAPKPCSCGLVEPPTRKPMRNLRDAFPPEETYG